MIGDTPEFDAFISAHRWAVLSTVRQSGQPSSSMVAYARVGDRLVVSTPGNTFKRRSLDRNPRLTLCIISNSEPFNFVTVEGQASILSDDIAPATRAVFANIEDTGFTLPEDLDGWLVAQARVIIELEAQRVYGVIR